MFQNNPNSSDNDKIINYPLQHQMPNPTSWNIKELNWNFEGTLKLNGNIKQFTATTVPSGSPTINPPLPCKRKTLDGAPTYRPTKQFISERKMIENMSGLHLSSNFTTHNISPDDVSEDLPYKVFLSPADLEEKLRNAQRITVCEQIKNLTEGDNLLPKALVDRAATTLATPMNALVLWQPPSQILKIYDKFEEKAETEQQVSEVNANQMESEELSMDNNNCLTIDFNTIGAPSDMDLDF